jgi:signal transduction histidine kinase
MLSKIQLERMEWLISILLKMARLESGAIEFKKSNTLLETIINRALTYLNQKLSDKNMTIELLKEYPDIKIFADEDWTSEAFENILKNAIEHSFIDGKIKIILTGNILFSRIIIEDFGEGIKREDLPRIFDRFYKRISNFSAEKNRFCFSVI